MNTIIEVGVNRALFDGHFPGHPILPGAKLLDLVIERLQAAAVLNDGPIEVAAAKFLAMIAPGTQVALSWAVTADGSCRFECTVGEHKVASGLLRDRPLTR